MSEHFTLKEKEFVLKWMQNHAFGRANAKFRDKILSYLMMSDRKFRRIIHELQQEGHIYSSAAWGYFFMPLTFPSDLDIDSALEALKERKAKALSTIESVDRNRKKLEGLRQGQQTFSMAR